MEKSVTDLRAPRSIWKIRMIYIFFLLFRENYILSILGDGVSADPRQRLIVKIEEIIAIVHKAGIAHLSVHVGCAIGVGWLVGWLFCDWWDSKKIHTLLYGVTTTTNPWRGGGGQLRTSLKRWEEIGRGGYYRQGSSKTDPRQNFFSTPFFFFAKDNFVSPPHRGLISYVNNFLQFNTNRVSFVR